MVASQSQSDSFDVAVAGAGALLVSGRQMSALTEVQTPVYKVMLRTIRMCQALIPLHCAGS
jgi:hypothetical protein